MNIFLRKSICRWHKVEKLRPALIQGCKSGIPHTGAAAERTVLNYLCSQAFEQEIRLILGPGPEHMVRMRYVLENVSQLPIIPYEKDLLVILALKQKTQTCMFTINP